MRFPSVTEAGAKAGETARRFPLALAAGGIAAVAAVWAVGAVDAEALGRVRLVLAALAGIPLLFAVAMDAERRGWSSGRTWFAGVIALAVPVGFWLLSDDWSTTLLFTRFFHLAAGLHLVAATLPFLGLPGENGFWQYNRTLFLRFLLSGLYSVVLFAGLALALLALDQLFGVDIDGETYPRLFFVIAFFFNTWFFLGGAPPSVTELEAQRDYPAGLRVFTQFVLMPLVAIYLVILTAYLGRVLLTQTWPSGWIGWLVSSVAVAGTLALLLVHPLRERAGHGWINAYGRWFFVALLPSVGMLLAAIAKRVAQYGVTERRYFLLVLALYLGGIAIWYAVSGSRRIRTIPLALALVALLTLAGPWSAYAVSRRSQLGRVERALERNGMLVEGRAQAASGAVPVEDRAEISGALEYLIATHGARSIAPLVGAELAGADSTVGGRAAMDRASTVMQALGLEYVSRWETGRRRQLAFTVAADSFALAVEGYAHLLQTDFVRPQPVVVGGDTVTFRMDSTTFAVTVARNGAEVVRLDLAAVLDRLEETGGPFGEALPAASMVLEAEGEGGAARVLLQNVNGTRAPEGDRLFMVRALVLLRFR
jgi:hypothetical protein